MGWNILLGMRNIFGIVSQMPSQRRPVNEIETALLAVGKPDILHLGRVLQEPSTFPLRGFKPVDDPAFVGEYLFQISYGKRLGRRRIGFIRKTPDCIDIVMFGDRLKKL